MQTAHFTKNTANCTLYTSHGLLHTAHCTLHTAYFILHSVHTAHFTLNTEHCIFHTAHCTMHTEVCTPHAAQCTMGWYNVNQIQSFFAIEIGIDTSQYETVLIRDVGNPMLNILSKIEYATVSVMNRPSGV